MTRTIRIDPEVAAELNRRRLPSERNLNGAIDRSLEERELQERLDRVGLGTNDVARLHELRAMRGAP